MPWLFDQSVSFAPVPFMYRAAFMRIAFVIAGLGAGWPWLMKCWRISAAAPATSGVAWLVPEEAVYHCWPAGKKFDPPVPPQTPVPLKQARRGAGARDGLTIAAWKTPPERWVAGATRSGFLRPSDVGPRLEKLMMSLALSAPVSPMPQPSAPPNGLDALGAADGDDVLAGPGRPTVFAPEPPLPAAKTMTISWLPATGNVEPAGCASRTSAS